MKKIKFLMLSIFTVSLFLVSCGENIEEAQVLVEYLESADSPIKAESIAKYITAADVETAMLTGNPYIIDIRSAADYSTLGHIDGAVNVAAGEVIAHLDGMDVSGYSNLVIACYTGQTAGFVTSLVRMAGYDAYSLKWGMSSWNVACAGSLNTNSVNTYATQLVTDVTDKAAAGELPVLSTTKETGADILDAQVATVLADGFSTAAITAADVWASPEDFYIVNYWNATHYGLGHIPGAIQYTPNSVDAGDLFLDTELKTLPTNQTIVVYCYTGQTSAFMAAYLKVLGYDAKSLKFGMNGMATDWATTNELTHWDASKYAGDRALVTGTEPSAPAK